MEKEASSSSSFPPVEATNTKEEAAAAEAAVAAEKKDDGIAEEGADMAKDTNDQIEVQQKKDRVVYGKDVAHESDEIKFKWNAIFHSFTAEQKECLALDEVSMYSITDTRSANNTSKIIQKLVGDRATITDGCAAAGGNTLSFAQHFRKVNAVELDLQRYSLLQHNIKALGYQNKVKTYNGDFLELMPQMKQDVVFLDPPWGGKMYTENDKVDLSFGDVPLAVLCERLKAHAEYIALKLPLNFNFEGFRKVITSSVVRADDRCARKQLLVILDTLGREHRGGFKRDRDDRPAPWQIKRKT